MLEKHDIKSISTDFDSEGCAELPLILMEKINGMA